MKRCLTCGRLEGQPGDVEPPREMKAESQYFASNGVVEIYRCRSCGSQWERFVASEKPGARSGGWKHLKAPAAHGARRAAAAKGSSWPRSS
jgi:hypothetical protein